MAQIAERRINICPRLSFEKRQNRATQSCNNTVRAYGTTPSGRASPRGSRRTAPTSPASRHTDIAATRLAYEWVVELCVSMGGDESDFVPFEKYANAALSLVNPSSAARALANGAPNIERVDTLVQTIAAQQGMQSDSLDETVELVDGWLETNRAKA